MKAISTDFSLLIVISIVATVYIGISSCTQDKSSLHIAEAKVDGYVSRPSAQLDPSYWYQGKAEITKYDLIQNRYQDQHSGELISIFVTEDFLTDRQVKNDHYTNSNSTSVLKLNLIRRFTTGLYDYAMMTSVFVRADGSATEKVTHTSQDWCGQSFMQINKKGAKYTVELRSYFESEGDQDVSISADLVEDAILPLLRIDPDRIPDGKVSLLPALHFLRLRHQPLSAVPAVISRDQEGSIAHISIKYPSLEREVKISYDAAPPYTIIALQENYPSAFDGQVRTSKADQPRRYMGAYWAENSVQDTLHRKELRITGFDSSH